MAKRMTPQQVKRMTELREQGFSYEAIGREVGCRGETVRQWLDPEARSNKANYRAEHRKEEREYSAKYYQENRDKVRGMRIKYYTEHREEELEKNAKWRREHSKERRAYEAKRYIAHREEQLEKGAKYRAAHRDYFREYSSRWNAEHRSRRVARQEARRARKLAATVGNPKATQHIYDIAANAKRVRCYLCGGLIPKGERHVDHIVPLSKGGLHTASNLAIACAKCNLSKNAKLPEEVGILI